jgi:hypothetical protein
MLIVDHGHEISSETGEQVRRGATPRAAVSKIIEICASHRPNPNWAELKSLDYDADITRLSKWLRININKSTLPFQIHTMQFWLFNPIVVGKTSLDMFFSISDKYDRDDLKFEWLETARYHSPESRPGLVSLHAMYDIAYYNKRPLMNDAEWPIGLTFAVTAVPLTLRQLKQERVLKSKELIGVITGFQSGDAWRIGELIRGKFMAWKGSFFQQE